MSSEESENGVKGSERPEKSPVDRSDDDDGSTSSATYSSNQISLKQLNLTPVVQKNKFPEDGRFQRQKAQSNGDIMDSSEDDNAPAEEEGLPSPATPTAPSSDDCTTNSTTDTSSIGYYSREPRSNSAMSTTGRTVRFGYCDAYRELLNSEIKQTNALADPNSDRAKEFKTTIIGASVWSASEKRAFFDAIALKGRDQLPFISKATGKSEIEVRDFTLLLEQGVEQSLSKSVTDSGYGFHQVPAAAELSDEIVRHLDQAADCLARLQYGYEVQLEQGRHGEDWLIDWEYVENSTETGVSPASDVDGNATTNEQVAAGADRNDRTEEYADLLNSKNLLLLSRNLYMHHEDPDKDWETYVEDGPAIFKTALNDLQGLVISITKRIIYTALFQYSSRMQATQANEKSRQGRTAVSKADVRGAISILGLKPNSTDYWESLPSRLGHTYFYQPKTRKSEQGWKAKAYRVPTRDAEAWLANNCALDIADLEVLTHMADETIPTGATNRSEGEADDQVGDAENQPANHHNSSLTATQDTDTDSDASTQFSDEEDSGLDNTDGDDYDEGRDESVARAARNNRPSTVPDAERAIELCDLSNSSEEEARLWRMLGLRPPSRLKSLSDVQVHLRSKPRRLDVLSQHAANWRQATEYTSQWMRDSSTPKEQDFGDTGERRTTKRGYNDSAQYETPFWAKRQRIDTNETLKVKTEPGLLSSEASLESKSTSSASPTFDEETSDSDDNDTSGRSSQSRRSSLPRRASSLAMGNLAESLQARSELSRDSCSDDDFVPRDY